MAIPFLQHIDLNKNELQNAVVQNLGTAPSSPAEGQIYYDSTVADKSIYVYNGSAWIGVGGDITRVNITAGNGLSGTSVDTTTGEHIQTLTVGNGTGITVNSGDVAVTAAQTGITSIINAALVTGRDADNQIKYSTDDQIIFRVAGADGILMKASGEIEATKFDGALEGNADTATVATTVTITDNENTDEENAILFSAGADADGGNLGVEQDHSGLTYNPSTGGVTATLFTGPLTGNVSGNVTGSSGSCTGNAATATLASTVTVTETSSGVGDFNMVYHNGSNGLLDESSAGTFFYSPSTETLTVKNLNVTVKTTQKEVELINTSSGVIFEGSSDDAHETTLDVTNPTADRAIVLPDASGTVALTSGFSGTNTGDQLVFKNVASDSGTAVADTITDTLTIAGGTNIATAVSGDTLTITGTDTQLATAAALIDVSAMAGNNIASFTHSLATKNLIIQLYDTTSGLVVHADIDHTSINAIAISFAHTGTEMVAASIGDIRVVVIDAVHGVTDKTVSYS